MSFEDHFNIIRQNSMREDIVEDTAEEVDSLPEIDEDYVKHREYAAKKYSKIEQDRVKDGIKSKADEFEEDESDANHNSEHREGKIVILLDKFIHTVSTFLYCGACISVKCLKDTAK